MLSSFKLLLKSKFFWIDFIFYFHITLGIPIPFLIVLKLGGEPSVGAFLWVGIFIPILILKFYKDMQKAKLKEKEFYNKKNVEREGK